MTDYENDATPPVRPENGAREAIWSVPSVWARPGFLVFCVLTIQFTTFLTWHDIRPAADADIDGVIAALLRNIFPSGGAAAVTIIILAEALQYIMATLDYLRNKWVKPLIDRYRAEGRAEVYERVRQWQERREAAQQAGLPFDEPPPSSEEPQ